MIKNILQNIYHLKIINAENAADFKHLRGGIFFVDKFPLTASGKVQRKKVQEFAIQEFEKLKN